MFIVRNRRRNRVEVEYISVSEGTCCWETCDRHKNCDTLSPGDEKSPSGHSIYITTVNSSRKAVERLGTI